MLPASRQKDAAVQTVLRILCADDGNTRGTHRQAALRCGFAEDQQGSHRDVVHVSGG
jgi:hypothetical protein